MTRTALLTLLSLLTAGPALPQTAEWFHYMQEARTFEAAGDFRAATVSLRAAVRAGEQDSERSNELLPPALNRLAMDYDTLGRCADAVPTYQRALAIVEKTRGTENTGYAVMLANLAAVFIRLHEITAAERLLVEAISIHDRTGAADGDALAVARSILSLLLVQSGKWTDAAPLAEQNLVYFESVSSREPSGTRVAMALNNMAVIRGLQGRHLESFHLLQRALNDLEMQSERAEPIMVEPLNNMATVYANLGKVAEAEVCYKRAIAIAESRQLTTSPIYAQVLANYAELVRRSGRKKDAARLQIRAGEAAHEYERANGIGLTVSALSLRRAAK